MLEESNDFNLLEKVLLSYESESFSYNCGVVLHFSSRLDALKLKEAIVKLVEIYPILNSKIIIDKTPKRALNQSFDVEDYLYVLLSAPLDNKDFTNKLALERGQSFRIYLYQDEEKSSLKFYIHHSLVDGISHAQLVKALMSLYSERPCIIENREERMSVFKKYSLLKCLRYLLNKDFREQFFSLSKEYDCFTLVEYKGVTKQSYETRTIDLNDLSSQGINDRSRANRVTSFNLILNYICESLYSVKRDDKRNIVVAFPINLRSFIKSKNYFGNMVTLTRMEIPYEKVISNESLLSIKTHLRKIVNKSFLAKSIECVNILSSLMSFKKMQKTFSMKAMDSSNINSTIMVSYMKVNDDTFCENTPVEKIELLSSIFKSPGMGAVITEYRNRYYLTFTFSKNEIDSNLIDAFIIDLKKRIDC